MSFFDLKVQSVSYVAERCSIKKRKEKNYEEGNLEIDFAVDCEYSHGNWNDPGGDFLYGVLVKRKAVLGCVENRLF